MSITLISDPTLIEAAGTPPKQIREYVGRASTGTARASVARMTSPAGWSEPGQTPEFDEFTLVLAGTLVVEHATGRVEVKPDQGVCAPAGEWIRYSTPEPTSYVSGCMPAFDPEIVNRDEGAEQ